MKIIFGYQNPTLHGWIFIHEWRSTMENQIHVSHLSLSLSLGSLSRKVGRMAHTLYIRSPFLWLHVYGCIYMIQLYYSSSHIAMKFLSLPNCSRLDCDNRDHLLSAFFLNTQNSIHCLAQGRCH